MTFIQDRSFSFCLAQTKLEAPVPPPAVIPREELFNRVRDSLLASGLTLLSAPTGYGKTTTLASVGDFLPELPVAWFSLDDEDNDFYRFFLSMVTTLGGTIDGLQGGLRLPGSSPGAAPKQVHPFMSALINGIMEEAANRPFLLILDNYHVIEDQRIHQALAYLLRWMPHTMHIAIATRTEPPIGIPRLRSQGRLTELRSDDLRFSGEEIQTLLGSLFDMHLSPEDLCDLWNLTEGWPAAVQVLARSLKELPGEDARSKFIRQLQGEGCVIPGLLDEEVLDRQEPETRRFLLETSILQELSVSRCRHLLGKAEASRFLRELDRRNLFVSPGDPARRTLHYHPIFRCFLRQRLHEEMPDSVQLLHQRAAQVEECSDRALVHFLEAKLWEPAVEILLGFGQDLLQKGFIRSLCGHIQSLPPDLKENHPRLLYLHGASVLRLGEFDRARSILEDALTVSREAGQKEDQLLTLVELIQCTIFQANLERSIHYIDEAITDSAGEYERMRLLASRSWISLILEDWDKGTADFNACLALLPHMGEIAACDIAANLHPFMASVPGALVRLHMLFKKAAGLAPERSGRLKMMLESQLAFTELWQGRIEDALHLAQRVLRVNRKMGYVSPPIIDLRMAYVLAAGHAAGADAAAALRIFPRKMRMLEGMPLMALFEPGFLYMQARTLWVSGHIREARHVHESMKSLHGRHQPTLHLVLGQTLQGLMTMASGELAKSEETLRTAAAGERYGRMSVLFGSARLALARLYHEWNRPVDALDALGQVIEEYERENALGLVAMEMPLIAPVLNLAAREGVCASAVRQVMSAIGSESEIRSVRVHETGECLTSREIEVLQCIARGMSNRDIADKLFISLPTVKTHTRRIYHKMNVSSREEASERARTLQMV